MPEQEHAEPPQSLRLQKKKHSPAAIAVAVIVVCLAVGFMVYKIVSALGTPDIPAPLSPVGTPRPR